MVRRACAYQKSEGICQSRKPQDTGGRAFYLSDNHPEAVGHNLRIIYHTSSQRGIKI